MINTLYIEREIAEHPRAKAIIARFPNCRQVPIERYGDVFNQSSQNFRQQKQQPALILAKKHGKRVLPTPPGYHIGGKRNYYFSHMMNCVYDCRYCFLQGMYRSGNYVVFANFDDFFDDIRSTSEEDPHNPAWFFSGYDCDSLALNPMTEFTNEALDQFATMPHAFMELRTKSTQIRPLLKRDPVPNVVVAYSLSPAQIASAHEHKAPSLEKRIQALKDLQDAGWTVGLRFDPILYADNFKDLYTELFDQTLDALDVSAIHSVSLGPFRLPKPFYKRMIRLYPDSDLLAQPMRTKTAMVSYHEDTESELLSFCENELLKRINKDQYFPCVSISNPMNLATVDSQTPEPHTANAGQSLHQLAKRTEPQT